MSVDSWVNERGWESLEGTVVHVADPQSGSFDRIQRLTDGLGVQVIHHCSHLQLLEQINDRQLGCVIMDIRFPEVGGLVLLEWLNERGTLMPLIFLTDYGTIPTAVRAVQLGAIAFFEKSCRDQDLWEAIHRAICIHGTRLKERGKRERVEMLTGSERQVLKRLLDGKSNSAISRELKIGIRTVELRRANVLKKLRIRSIIDLYRELHWLDPADLDHRDGSVPHLEDDP